MVTLRQQALQESAREREENRYEPEVEMENTRKGRQDSVENQQTDVDALMDAVGNAGVDINAEEESMRLANERRQVGANAVREDRSRRQDFIEPSLLAECIKKIAAAFVLKTLEPDTIPLIALAVRHRLASLINDSIAARDHRLNATHLKPPPFVTKKRKRGVNEFGEEEDEFDSDDDFDGFNFNAGKGKEKEPAWDHVIFDDQEKILGVLERVDREEEKNQRRARMIRDEKETEARELAEAVAASEAAEREAMGYAGPSTASLLTSIPGSMPSTPGPSKSSHSTPGGSKDTPAGPAPYGYTPTGKPKKEPKAKKKKEGPLVTAKNMTADVSKRLSDQTAMRSVGGRQFAWLNPGGSASPGMNSPTPGSLPKPKFAPASSLPNPTFNTPSRPLPPNPFDTAPKPTTTSHPLSRLANVPAKHDASRAAAALQDWQESQNQVELKDLIWALERERGMGAGSGSGQKPLLKSFSFQGKR